MKEIRSGIVTLAALARLVGLVSCASTDAERHAAVEQRIEQAEDVPVTAACAHAACATGEKLAPTCDPCVTLVCASDPFCCNDTWDATCVGEVTSICGKSCTTQPGGEDAGASTCAHPICASGGALQAACAPCATQVCAQDPYCCAVAWDETCVAEVGSICAIACN